jgi:cob(I)alamin adenosyltransferase
LRLEKILEETRLKIYTGFGDTGKTRLYGGQVVDKDDLRVKAYGTMDELNSMVGLLITYIDDKELIGFLQGIQYNLFDLSAELASLSDEKTKSAKSAISEETVKEIESKIDDINSQLEPLKNFILPGGSRSAALCHLTRTVCRRAERELITLLKVTSVNEQLIMYINRLSDYFFVLARLLNKQNNMGDIPWIKK